MPAWKAARNVFYFFAHIIVLDPSWKTSSALYVQNAAIGRQQRKRSLQATQEKAVTAIIITTNPKFFLTVSRFVPGLTQWLTREQFDSDLKSHTWSHLWITWGRQYLPLCVVLLQPVPLYLQLTDSLGGRLFHFPPVSKCLDLFDGSNAPFPRWICSQLF